MVRSGFKPSTPQPRRTQGHPDKKKKSQDWFIGQLMHECHTAAADEWEPQLWRQVLFCCSWRPLYWSSRSLAAFISCGRYLSQLRSVTIIHSQKVIVGYGVPRCLTRTGTKSDLEVLATCEIRGYHGGDDKVTGVTEGVTWEKKLIYL
jgi:hypothetical protein